MMNERIRELVAQAHMHADANYNEGPDEEWWKEYINKFAELLIQDAVNVCLAERDPQNLNYKPSVKFADAIKQHFGVK